LAQLRSNPDIRRVIEAANSRNNIAKERACSPRDALHAAVGHEIYGHDLSARLFVRDDRESQSLCTDLTDFASGSRAGQGGRGEGERRTRPADAARITKSQRDPRALSTRKKKRIPRDCPMQFVVHRVIRVLVLHSLYDALEPPSSRKTADLASNLTV